MRAQAIALAATIAIAALGASSARAVNVVNGSFEDVAITSQGSSNLADIPGWTHSGSTGDGLIWTTLLPVCCGGTNATNAGDGNQFVTMGGGFGPTGSSAWSQTLTGLSPGKNYVVHFMMAAEGEVPTQVLTVSMTGGSSTAPQNFTSIPTNTLFWQNWGADSYTFRATSSSATLQFSVTDEVYDVGLDAVSVSAAVPEPASWAMMLLGLGLIGAALRGYHRLNRELETPAG
jgi:hypothetical protein